VSLGPVSRVYRTAAIGQEAGEEFLNAAAEIETELPPLELLDLLQSVEADFGRTRTIHWGPRPLDLDLILYGDHRVELPRLAVPHPACWYRRFVLDPLCEIAGNVVHPQKGVTLDELRRRLLARPFRVLLTGSDRLTRTQLIESLRPQFGNVEFHEADTPRQAGDFAPALLIWLGPVGETDFPDCPTLRLAWLDASTAEEDRATFVRNVLASATQEPRPHSRPLRNTP
jgi:2-amino-4-hydroxy-6-hydroxymethyldihydropteridine diphosphokinase